MAGKTVVLNGDKINFDGKMDYTCLSEQVTVYGCSQQEEILERVQDQEIVITKELAFARLFVIPFSAICQTDMRGWDGV